MNDKINLYEQAQTNLRYTDEISFKLMSLVPIATLFSFIAIFFRENADWNDWLYLAGVFGSLVVFGVYRWELRNIQNCTIYRNIIQEFEKNISELKGVEKYQKPKLWTWEVGKTQAEKLIYSTLVLSWLVLPFILKGLNTNLTTSSYWQVGYLAFCGIMIMMLLITGFSGLEKNKKDQNGKSKIIEIMPDEDNILFKELDLIDNTISNLDKQIQTTKTVCITLWTAWIGWFIAQDIDRITNNELGWLLMGSAVFPIIFWIVDSFYRESLLSSSKRESLISLYLNSEMENIDFPILDPVGWLYHQENYTNLIDAPSYKIPKEKKKELENESSKIKKYTYKEAPWFYLPLIILSFLLGGYFIA